MNKTKIRIFKSNNFTQYSLKKPAYFPSYIQYWLKQKGLCYNIFWL